ncbi:aminopeptidase P family N-terminal domain-containing protein [Mesorhizobium australicum]|uniref:aminopeptidase P family N-terminal domain-containing protein n=1 Tax=Mesorhizobium australicum TaxID=536018 RepID=UPI00333620F1
MMKELHFEVAEFQARLAAVKREMAKRGIDFLILSEPPNQNYITGDNAYSFYTPQMVMTTYLTDDKIRTFPESHVHSPVLSAYDIMADIVKEVGGERT